MKNVSEIIGQNKALKEKFSNLGSYGIVVRDNEGHWTGTFRQHFEGVRKDFGGILFVRKFNVSFLMIAYIFWNVNVLF